MDNPFKKLEERFDRLEAIISAKLDQAHPRPIAKNDLGGIRVAMEETGLARSTIYKLVSQGQIPFHKKRKKLYFSRQELERWIKEGRR